MNIKAILLLLSDPGLVPVGHRFGVLALLFDHHRIESCPCSRLVVVALGVDLPHRVAHQEGYEEREGNQIAKSLTPSLSLVTLKFKSSPILRGPSRTCVGSPPAQD